jgi:type IV pilus assembly protein PilM
VVAGEVVDLPVVSAALRRLWKEGGFGSREVVVGVANSRVVARVVDLPVLPDDELRSSLRWQVQDLIPLPIEDAELDLQVIERPAVGAGPDARLKALLVAAHRDMLRSLLAALDGASLKASRIDLVPFALVRALSQPGSWLDDDAPDYEVIVGSGAGVTNVVVHEHGIPHFVRSLPTGGWAVTEALGDELGIELATAEALKREQADTPEQARVDAVAANMLVPLASDVAGSLDFHLAQIGRGDLRRVVLAGGGVRLHALRRALEDHLGVPVVDGDPFASLDTSKAPLDEGALGSARDLFATAVGLALAGSTGDAISLLPSEVHTQRAERRQLTMAAGGVGTFAALLVLLAFARGSQVDGARAQAAKTEAQTASIERQVNALNDVEKTEADIAAGRETARLVLDGDVDWPALFRDVGTVIPDDVWLNSFSATRTPGEPTNLQFSASGPDQTSAARWLLRLEDLDKVEDAWLTDSSKKTSSSGREIVEFASTATLDAGGNSDRAAKYGAEADS